MDELINFEDLKEADDLLFKNALESSSELDSQHSSFSGLNRSFLTGKPTAESQSPLVTALGKVSSPTSLSRHYKKKTLSKHAEDRCGMEMAGQSDTDLNRIITTATSGRQEDVLFDLDSVTLQVSGSIESLSIVEDHDDKWTGSGRYSTREKEPKVDGYVKKPLPAIPSDLAPLTVATDAEKSLSADLSFNNNDNNNNVVVSSVLDNFVLDSPNTSLCQTPRSLLVATDQTPVKSPTTIKPSISEDRYKIDSPALSLSPTLSQKDSEEPELDDSPQKPFGGASQLRRVPSRLRSPTKHISAFRNKPATFSPQSSNTASTSVVAAKAESPPKSATMPTPTTSSLVAADKPVIKRGFLFRSGSMMNRKRDVPVKPLLSTETPTVSRYSNSALTSTSNTAVTNSPELTSPALSTRLRHSRSHSMESSVLVNTASTPSLLRRPSIITKKLATTTANVEAPTLTVVTAPPVNLSSPVVPNSGSKSAIPRLTSRIRSRFFDKKPQ